MLQKAFSIKILKDGRQYPILNIAPKQYEMLYELGMYQLSKSEGVRDAVDNLDKVENGQINQYELSTGDWCVVDVKKDTSIITNNFDEFEPVEIPTSEIVKLMKEWFDFLSSYENGEIPGIIHPDKRDFLFINFPAIPPHIPLSSSQKSDIARLHLFGVDTKT